MKLYVLKKSSWRRRNNKNQNFETTKPCGSARQRWPRDGKLSFFTVKQPYLWPNIYYLNIKGEGYEKSLRGSYCCDGFPSPRYIYRSMATPNRRTLFFNDFHKAFISSQVLEYFFFPLWIFSFILEKKKHHIIYIYIYIQIYIFCLFLCIIYMHTIFEMTETRHDINPNNNDIKKLA